jgi:hypothetical protein
MEKKRIYIELLQKELKTRRPITNATIVLFQTYDDTEHGFQELLARQNGDMRSFLREIAKIQSRDFKKTQDEDFNVCSRVGE